MMAPDPAATVHPRDDGGAGRGRSDDRFVDRHVLVTGASGFLGGNLCNRLLAAGATVHAASRAIRASSRPRLRWWPCDLSSLEAVRALMTQIRPDVVYHLSGLVNRAPELDFVIPTFSSLLQSTINILTVGTELNCRRMIVTGSLTEPEDNLPPSSPYAAEKWACGAYARMFHELFRAPVVVLRLFMVYGPGQAETRLVPSVILSLLRGQTPKVSSGRWQTDWVYVDDIITGFMAAAFHPNVEGCTIDLGTGIQHSIRDVVHAVLTSMDSAIEPAFGALPDRTVPSPRHADTNYAWEKLGWKAATPLEAGIANTVSWFRNQVAGGAES
jgi:nucleoside-diphosphate-sugar epimerase